MGTKMKVCLPTNVGEKTDRSPMIPRRPMRSSSFIVATVTGGRSDDQREGNINGPGHSEVSSLERLSKRRHDACSPW